MDLKLRYSTNNKRFFPLSLWFSLSLHEISASSALDCLQKYCIAFEVVLCEQAVSNESGVLQLTGTTFSDTGSPYQLTIPVQIQANSYSLPAASRRSRVGWFSRALAFRSLYYPWGKMRDYSKSIKLPTIGNSFRARKLPHSQGISNGQTPGVSPREDVKLSLIDAFDEQQRRPASHMRWLSFLTFHLVHSIW